ncbi:HAD-IIB family hydrolase [Paeniroseomonas aquatica]|uniref:sucrose-phosphate synthase n=1 Tax=Paeniroseomonas aquatica TaxID=373043 RepID=A0ABT8AHF4_9PROT|nr:HAD-IIB family hydrolase [Paeniroseomonas aquatica]MDN3568799.1 HAD-IIB family hydrolase [Paeniroseomonas aquatica]
MALGGCLKARPVHFGLTADTGGHIAYVLEAAANQAQSPDVSAISLVTRLFEDDRLGLEHARPAERLNDKIQIHRIATSCRAYLEKEALGRELPEFKEAFCRHLAALPALPDVIHAHFADAAAVAMHAKARYGIPFVYTPHALGINKRNEVSPDPGLDLRIEAERQAIASADAIIVSSHDEADQQIAAYGVEARTRTFRMAPGVPQHHGSLAGSGPAIRLDKWLMDPAKPIILAVARPVRKKNLAALVRAYSGNPGLQALANLVILAGQHDGYHGSAEESQVIQELRQLCLAPALQGRVALPPRHAAADVAALYERAAAGGIFVNPALHEPFGLTLIEAAAAGVPVVATRHGGPAEIVGTLGHGLLIDPRDETAIGTACLSLLTDPDRHARFAAAARRNIHHYCWSSYAGRSIALYGALRRQPRLLACDIDGTLTGCPTAAEAFATWRAERRLPFVVATGRSFDAAQAILREWRLPQPDAYIVDVGTRLMLPVADGDWVECATYAEHLTEDWNRPAVAATLAGLALTPQPSANDGQYKFSFFGRPDEADAIRAALAAAGLAARVIHSHGRLIDVLAPRGGKAAAIAAYAKRQGMTLADCVAAGDSGNDLDMLDACGHAIVVGNADGDLDGLRRRHGLHRAAGRHAAGVMEGLAALGLSDAAA